jgi:hypothetical protein
VAKESEIKKGHISNMVFKNLELKRGILVIWYLDKRFKEQKKRNN